MLSRWPQRARPCFSQNNTIFVRDSSTFVFVSIIPVSHYSLSHWWIGKDSHSETRTLTFLSWRRGGSAWWHDLTPFEISFPRIWKALSQISQGLALQPVLVQTVHWLSSILHHPINCNEAMGTASTKMAETVDMDQYQRDVCVEKMTDENQALWSRCNIFFLAELMQVHTWLHEFFPISFSWVRTYWEEVDWEDVLEVGWEEVLVWVSTVFGEPRKFIYVLKMPIISICDLHLLSVWPCSECSATSTVESITLLSGDALAWECSAPSKLQFNRLLSQYLLSTCLIGVHNVKYWYFSFIILLVFEK